MQMALVKCIDGMGRGIRKNTEADLNVWQIHTLQEAFGRTARED